MLAVMADCTALCWKFQN